MFRMSYKIPDPPPPPPVTFTIRSTEGHGTWKLTEDEARELHDQLGGQLAHLDHARAREIT